jgi:hypothetical protein
MAGTSCYQHYRHSESGLPAWENVSRVLDFHDEPDPNGVAPYERLHDSHPSETSCIPRYECHGDAPDVEFCELLTTGDILPCSGSGIVTVHQGLFSNCFKPVSGGTVDFFSCHKLGFKNCFAKVHWNGRYGYKSNIWGGYDWFNWCMTCAGKEYVASPDQTRYLSMSGAAHYGQTVHSEGGDVSYAGDYSATTSIGKYNGQPTASCSHSSSEPEGVPEGWFATQAFNLLGIEMNGSIETLQAKFYQLLHADDGLIQQHGMPAGIAGSGNSWSMTWTNEYGTLATLSISNGDSLVYEAYAPTEDGLSTYVGYHYALSYTETSAHLDFFGSMNTVHDGSSVSGWADAVLYDPYTASEVYENLTGLLSHWSLADD